MIQRIRVDPSWTLFLDRDGVINRKIENGYVTDSSTLEFLPGSLEAIAAFAGIFRRIIVVTNQRGIGRKLMTEEAFSAITEYLLSEVRRAGGRVDAVFHCPHLVEDKCECRKPGTLMPRMAKDRFPEIDFSRSIMVGDSSSDIVMGRRLGMVTVGIDSGIRFSPEPDFIASNLDDFLQMLSV